MYVNNIEKPEKEDGKRKQDLEEHREEFTWATHFTWSYIVIRNEIIRQKSLCLEKNTWEQFMLSAQTTFQWTECKSTVTPWGGGDQEQHELLRKWGAILVMMHNYQDGVLSLSHIHTFTSKSAQGLTFKIHKLTFYTQWYTGYTYN